MLVKTSLLSMLINLLYPLVNEYSYFLVQCCIKYTVEMSFQNKTLSEYVLQENTTLLKIKVLHNDIEDACCPLFHESFFVAKELLQIIKR